MIKYLFSIYLTLVIVFILGSCIGQAAGMSAAVDPVLPVPKGYRIVGRIGGDLNADGIQDSILIVKATAKDRLELDRGEKMVDRNRRG